jgi:hypothetical protein
MKMNLQIIRPGIFQTLAFVNTDNDEYILFYLDDAIATFQKINVNRFKEFLSLSIIGGPL